MFAGRKNYKDLHLSCTNHQAHPYTKSVSTLRVSYSASIESLTRTISSTYSRSHTLTSSLIFLLLPTGGPTRLYSILTLAMRCVDIVAAITPTKRDVTRLVLTNLHASPQW